MRAFWSVAEAEKPSGRGDLTGERRWHRAYERFELEQCG